LAFGIGSVVVFNLYFKHTEQSVIAQTTEINKLENKEQPSTSIQEISQVDEPNDEEKAAFDVLEPTIKKWLRGEKIKKGWNDITPELIKEVTGKNESQLSDAELHFWQDLGFQFTTYLIDTNGDSKNELAIQNQCAPVGNCKFWLFRRNGNNYETILETLGGAVQTFKLKSSKTNGYFDLETKSHGDAWSGGIEVYKFDGKQYKVGECYEYNYSYLKNGKLYELKKAKITPHKCDE
jgi:hypothetical protein